MLTWSICNSMVTDITDDVLQTALTEAGSGHVIHLIEFSRSTSAFRQCLDEVPALTQCQERGNMVQMWPDEPKMYIAPELVLPTKARLAHPVLMKSLCLIDLNWKSPNTPCVDKWVRWHDLRGRHVLASEENVELVLAAVKSLPGCTSIRAKRRCMIEVTSATISEEWNQLQATIS